MVYLEDGRKELYQWDTGIAIASTEACDVMEITRETYPLTRDADATLVGTMYRAEVPDELLTEAGYIKIALVTVAGDSRRTNAVYRMRIKPRAKPKHVFPDHHMNATTQEILMRISALEEKIKNGTIEGAVLYTKPQALKEEEKRTARENIDAVSSKNADGTERDYVFTTDTASIGQTVVVSEIDADGKPTKYKHSTPSSGGGGNGKDGATFTPDITDGVLSWTNDGGLPNPTPVKIKGEDGKDGAPGAKGATFVPDITDDVLSWTNDGNLKNPIPVNIKGKDGGKGEKGNDGITYKPSVTNGILSWSNNGGQANPDPVDITGPKGDQGAVYTPSVTGGVLSWTNNGGLPNPDPVTIGSGESGTVEGAVLYSQQQNLSNEQKSTACDNIGALRGELDDGQAVNVVTTTDTPTVGQTVVVTGFDSDGSPTYGHADLGSGSGGTGGTQNAVQYVPQTLTSDQQTQARKNIDAQSQVYAVKRANPWSAEDCLNAPVRGLKLYGACEQKQYSGKNLYDMSLQQTTTKNGLTFSYIPDEDCYCINGTCTLNDSYIIANFKVPIEQNQSYTLTFYPVGGSVTAADGLFKTLYIECGDAETEYTALETIDVGTVKKSRTETNTKSFYTRTRYFINEGVVFNNLKFRIQFEKSSTSTDYEPYVGGMPSPNPNYPQEVKCNDLTYNLIGKNLFNTAVLPSSSWDKISYYYLPIYVGKGKIVTLSHKTKLTTGLEFYLGFTLEEKYKGQQPRNGWIYHSRTASSINNKVVIIAKEDYIYLELGGDNIENADQYVFLDDFQIEYGAEKTDYEPYYNGGSVTAPSLYGIGDAQDEWDAITGNGVRRIKKKVFDGTENWELPTVLINGYSSYRIKNILEVPKKTILCNWFLYYDENYSINPKNKIVSHSDTTQLIFVVENSIADSQNQTSFEEWKSLLAQKYEEGNPLVIYYFASDDELFETTPAGQISMPDGYAQFLHTGDGAAGDIEAEYAVDIEKRYVPKENYKSLEERVAALESAAIGG